MTTISKIKALCTSIAVVKLSGYCSSWWRHWRRGNSDFYSDPYSPIIAILLECIHILTMISAFITVMYIIATSLVSYLARDEKIKWYKKVFAIISGLFICIGGQVVEINSGSIAYLAFSCIFLGLFSEIMATILATRLYSTKMESITISLYLMFCTLVPPLNRKDTVFIKSVEWIIIVVTLCIIHLGFKKLIKFRHSQQLSPTQSDNIASDFDNSIGRLTLLTGIPWIIATLMIEDATQLPNSIQHLPYFVYFVFTVVIAIGQATIVAIATRPKKQTAVIVSRTMYRYIVLYTIFTILSWSLLFLCFIFVKPLPFTKPSV